MRIRPRHGEQPRLADTLQFLGVIDAGGIDHGKVSKPIDHLAAGGDIVVHADYLPGDVAPGDPVAVPATGAYHWSMASNYNYLGRPPVVAVKDGSARLLVRRETERDLLSRDTGLETP